MPTWITNQYSSYEWLPVTESSRPAPEPMPKLITGWAYQVFLPDGTEVFSPVMDKNTFEETNKKARSWIYKYRAQGFPEHSHYTYACSLKAPTKPFTQTSLEL